jgi:hypothetical protein
MKTKRLLSLILTGIILLSVCSCNKDKDTTLNGSETESTSSIEETPAVKTYTYSLTGLETTTPIKHNRPVALTINNLYPAQKVQSGVGKADVVFETEAEGGITRLLALYQNPTKDISQIGTVRSVRVVFAELVASMDAVLVHHGIGGYAAERMSELGTERIEINTNNFGKREQNGLSWEHTLYTTGEMLDKALDKTGYGDGGFEKPWLNFSDEEITPAGNASTSVIAKFNGSYHTYFFYDNENKVYQRGSNNAPLKDYVTGETEDFKNVFILETTMRYYPDNKMRDIDLSGGNGYYITNGGYKEITWSKSGDFSPITFKNSNGEELSVNKGNSYICIMNKATSSFTAK